ncbi:MAG: 2-phosphosulfolactate phosphatase [Atopobiaceae bacterium]
MDIKILELIEGADLARGLTIIIDVFRAFTLECYLFAYGAQKILPTGSLDEARALAALFPDAVTFGERRGARVEGFDFGNAPSEVAPEDVLQKLVIHTTSAGTQGLVHAQHADEIITGSLVNARACARYIRARAPEQVSIVAMGNQGVSRAEEDVICACYIKSLLTGETYDVESAVADLPQGAGAKFLDPLKPEFPANDLPLCTALDRFDFVIRCEHEQGHLVNRKIEVASKI